MNGSRENGESEASLCEVPLSSEEKERIDSVKIAVRYACAMRKPAQIARQITSSSRDWMKLTWWTRSDYDAVFDLNVWRTDRTPA
jgi:hypothetical protein